jgi:hypothetical protein
VRPLLLVSFGSSHIPTGHSYLAPTTKCAEKVIRSYFSDGVIPEDAETLCEREVSNYFVDQKELAVNPALVARVLGSG